MQAFFYPTEVKNKYEVYKGGSNNRPHPRDTHGICFHYSSNFPDERGAWRFYNKLDRSWQVVDLGLVPDEIKTMMLLLKD